MSRRVVRRRSERQQEQESVEDLLGQAKASYPDHEDRTSLIFTDGNVANLMVAQEFSGKYRHAHGLGWLNWDGKRWREVPEKDAIEAARLWVISKYIAAQAEVVAAMLAQDKVTADQASDEAAGWHSYQSWTKTNAILKFAQGVAGVTTEPTDFDSDPELLNVQNGVVNLRTGELLPHDPDLLLRKIAGVEYRPGARHKDWDKALEALPADVVRWYQVHMGQAITGYQPSDDTALIQQGGGSNGKTTIVNAIAAALGDYYLIVPDKAIIGASANSHTTEMTDFLGMRVAVLEETPEDGHLNMNRIKKLLGTKKIRARKMRQDDMEFDNISTLIINTNFEPHVTEGDDGTWRRLLLVRFPYHYVQTEDEILEENDRLADHRLRDRLQNDYDGQGEAVLAWLVAGAIQWFAANRSYPDKPKRVQDDTAAWRASSDLLYNYITSELTPDEGSFIPIDALYRDFCRWLTENGHHEWTKDTMSKRLKGHAALREMRAVPGKAREGQAAKRRSARHFEDHDEYKTGSEHRVIHHVRFAQEAASGTTTGTHRKVRDRKAGTTR
jgi:P4 family phage/plasmid primase-like protien